ncbi:MAG: DM13 domain-containing protein [Cyanothece sp. SIO1E1]|nr:DM13 domain-containing protein [Cyanothece sp. SIO1E1]
MRQNYPLLLNGLAILLLSCNSGQNVGQSPNSTERIVETDAVNNAESVTTNDDDNAVGLTASTQQAEQIVVKSGPFTGSAHPTQGLANLMINDGTPSLVLDPAFKTDSGPDLFVLLHRAEVPENYNPEDYVELGVLQQVSGSQTYTIPEDVNLEEYNSAVIWCRQFNVTFGYATLN